MKDLPIIEDILLVWNFKQCNSEQDIRTINKAQARLALTFLFVTLIFVGFQFFNVKWTDINSPLFVPAIIMIIIAGVAGGVVWRKEKEIKELVSIYKMKENQKIKEVKEKNEAPMLKITMSNGEEITGKFIEEEKGWLRFVGSNQLYNKNFISKIEIL
jgi:hypothetical protein